MLHGIQKQLISYDIFRPYYNQYSTIGSSAAAHSIIRVISATDGTRRVSFFSAFTRSIAAPFILDERSNNFTISLAAEGLDAVNNTRVTRQALGTVIPLSGIHNASKTIEQAD